VIVIHCRFTLAAADREQWIESAQRMAEISRTEAGCLEYAFSADVSDPLTMYSYQEWESQETLDAHEQAPHHARRMAELAAWDVDYQKIAFYGVAWQRNQVRA
jgi:quinol monooxygenase YgiN